MSKTLWRVTWTLATTDISQSTEFAQEEKAVKWAEGLLKGGANGIFVTELILGKTVRIDTETPLFQK